MDCLYCASPTFVTNSRPQVSSNNIWRRRRCTVCSGLFTTIERADLSTGLMLRKKNSLEPLSRDVLFVTVYESCRHRSKAIEDASALTQHILSQVVATAASGVVERDHLVGIATQMLNRLDKTAGAVYAAFHPVATDS